MSQEYKPEELQLVLKAIFPWITQMKAANPLLPVRKLIEKGKRAEAAAKSPLTPCDAVNSNSKTGV